MTSMGGGGGWDEQEDSRPVLQWVVAMSDLERDLGRLVSDYVAGQRDFGAFNSALAEASWDVAENDPGAHRLTYEVELLVAEFTSGHRPEPNLRSALSRVLGGLRSREHTRSEGAVSADRRHAVTSSMGGGGAWNATAYPVVEATFQRDILRARARVYLRPYDFLQRLWAARELVVLAELCSSAEAQRIEFDALFELADQLVEEIAVRR